MSSGVGALSGTVRKQRWVSWLDSHGWLPTWSPVAAQRALRATLVAPSVFAFCDLVIGNIQTALFGAFGSLATLVFVSFAGTRREKLIAHTMLALVATPLIVIGTAVNGSVVIAALVSVPVAFALFFSGVFGATAAAGVTAALLAYVLPAASPGTMSMVPDRLAGWWLASVAGTAAVLIIYTPPGGNTLRSAASKLASGLTDVIDSVLADGATEEQLEAAIDTKRALLTAFNSTPYRPTGLTGPDQALANAVELLEWCTALIVDTVHERRDLNAAVPADRELLEVAARCLRECGQLLVGHRARPDLEALEEVRRQSTARLHDLQPGTPDMREQAQISFHVHQIAVSVLALGAEVMVASRMATADWVAEARTRWFGMVTGGPGDERRLAGAAKYAGVAWRHASLRSVWFVNSLRGALSIAAAVAAADLLNVQHGFWVVLGTLSVLRSNAGATGATALRALAGTVAGFVIGAGLVLAIGDTSAVLWIVLPIAVLISAYAPGTAPFAVGQAAFTVTVVVLFNLLIPTGWKVGELRILDVALGCAVSILVGTFFWPRGASSVVGDDLADAYRSGARYLSRAVDCLCVVVDGPPDGAVPAITAGLRLDAALRGFLAEQGSKRLPKVELWRLVGGALRLRLTAHALAGLPNHDSEEILAAQRAIGPRAEILTAFYEQLAEGVGRPRGSPVPVLRAPTFDEVAAHPRTWHAIWLCEHLHHLAEHLAELVAPATHLAEIRRRPWWR